MDRPYNLLERSNKNNLQKKPPTTWSTETSLTASTTESRPSRKCSQSVSAASAQSITGVKKRAIHVNNNTLCPRMGSLHHRLSAHSGAHMPQLSDSKTPKCALHHWGWEVSKSIHCKMLNVWSSPVC